MGRKRIHDLDDLTNLSLSDDFVLDRNTGDDTFKTYKTELGNIREAIVNGNVGSLLLETGDFLLLETGDKLDLEGTFPPLPQSFIEPIETVTGDQVLELNKYYRITGGTAFTITLATPLFNAAVPFTMTIKNVSGSVVTITRTGSDQFFSLTGLINSFNLANGESVRLISVAADTWDII